MPRVIAYTYEADVHCIDCTRQRFGPCKTCRCPPPYPGDEKVCEAYVNTPPGCDEHAVPYDATDRGGNPVHPVFSTDETDFTHCHCGCQLR